MTQKQWGPFTGRQLTTIIVAVIIGIVVIPAGAWAAVSFTNVAITDPGGVNRAKVDATGGLHVGDGTGPLTVDGTVTARPTSLSALVHNYTFGGSSYGCLTLLAPPNGKALVVSNVMIDTYDNPTPGGGNYVALYVGAPGTCDVPVALTNPAGIETTSLPFSAGLAVPAGKSLNVQLGGRVTAEMFAFGYTVSSSSIPASAGAAAAPAAAPGPPQG